MNNIFSKKTKDESITYDTMTSLSHTKWNCHNYRFKIDMTHV